jgi:type IV fimbrial biogenesis protein FimT
MACCFELSGRFGSKMPEYQKSLVGNSIPLVGYGKWPWNPSVRSRQPFIRISGFTLIELVVTLAVVAILTLVTVPSISTFVQNNRIVTLTNDLISDINIARSEALKTGANVGVCMSQTGTACDGASWQAGRIVFRDTNNNGAFDLPSDAIVRAQSGMNNNTLNTTTLPNPLIFKSRGLPSNFAAGGIFLLCDQRGPTYGRSIQISPTGQVASDTNPPSSCN